jgi:predicted  nucleic acid-binding Zn-ribbon protein
MDYERELNQVQKDLDLTFQKIEAINITTATLEATHKQQYEKIVYTLEKLNKDMQELSSAVRTLESLATQGKSSLRTLLWVGGFMTALLTFIFNISGYWFSK